MKIYAARRQFENELDRYVGEDIWVKVKEGASCFAFVKLIEDTGYHYLGYRINSDLLYWPDIADYLTVREMKKLLRDVFNTVVKIPKSDTSLVKPVECIDTNDFINLIPRNISYIEEGDLNYLRRMT